MKNTRNFIIFILIVVILTMAIGYSTFASQLLIEGTAEIVGEWDVKIISVEKKFVSEGVDAETPQFTNTSVTFNAKLVKPGDKVSYLITIENNGNIDAILKNLNFNEESEGSEAIIYNYTRPSETLNAGDTTTLEVTILYDTETEEVPEIKTKNIIGTIEYVQK